MVNSGAINKDNILTIKDYADKKKFTSSSAVLGEYINKLYGVNHLFKAIFPPQ